MSYIGYKAAWYSDLNGKQQVAIIILDIPKPIACDTISYRGNPCSVKYHNPNNIGRKNIVEPQYAKYRCKWAYVLKIMDLKTKKPLTSAYSDYDEDFIYRVGQWVQEPYFNNNLNRICSKGYSLLFEY